MSRLRRIEIMEPYYSPLFIKETSIFTPKTLALPSFFEEDHDFSFALDFLNPSPFEVLDTFTDLIQIEKSPSFCSYKRIHQRVGPDFNLQRLCDRVASLECSFDRMVNARLNGCGGGEDRRYTWTAEIEGPVERKYKWTAEIKGDKKKKKKDEEEKKKKGVERNYKWTAEIKGDGPISRTYKIEASSGDAGDFSKSEKKDKKHNKGECHSRVVEIEEPDNHGVVYLKQAFAKRPGAIRTGRGKQKELSPQDAALMIQMTFRAYLIRRSQALRALRELAVAKTKLKEIRSLFNNFSYRRRISRDAEERQRFSERIIVLLLTVDAIEGADLMVRSAKRSMVDELEAMLDVVDPQPPGKSLSMRRRTFDMPDGAIQKEIAEGVAQVVQMLDQEESGTTTFEACL